MDGYSSGRFLAERFKQKGFQVIHIHSQGRPFLAMFEKTFKASDYDLDIPFRGDYDGVIARLSKFEKLAGVIAGADSGVILADELSFGVRGYLKHLPSNGIDYARKDKYMQHERLRKAGISYALQFKTNSSGRAFEWVRRNQMFKDPDSIVVVKPLRSAGTDGIFFCRSLAEIQAAMDHLLGKHDELLQVNHEVLLQEYLKGDEYVVNTTSRSGHHVVTDMWKYVKKMSQDGKRAIYDHDVLLPFEGKIQKDLIEYNEKVLAALGIDSGNGHTEIKYVPGRGPVLVEFNNRMMGSGQPMLAELAIGESQISRTVLAYTDPDAFFKLGPGYQIKQYAAVVTLNNDRAGNRLSTYSDALITAVPGYQTHGFLFAKGVEMPLTIDMLSSIGDVFIVRNSPKEIQESIFYIRHLEASGALFE